jgi:hypothetical protein
MNYRVLKFFIDRDTLKGFNAGDLFPCSDPDRAAELIKKCYIERVQDIGQQEAPKEPTKTAKAKSTVKKTATKKKA